MSRQEDSACVRRPCVSLIPTVRYNGRFVKELVLDSISNDIFVQYIFFGVDKEMSEGYTVFTTVG